MKLHLNIERNLPLFTGYGEDYVLINGARHDESLFISGTEIHIAPWTGLRFEALTDAHFRWITGHAVDIVLFGSGHRLRFPHPSLTRTLGESGIGLEVMDIGAMCRTYNILVGEGRNVAAAVLIEPAAPTGAS